MKRPILIAVGSLAFAVARAATPLSTVIDRALHQGVDGAIPPHLSTVLGLGTATTGTPVRQLVARAGHTVHTFNVDPAHRHEIVLFVVDEDAKVTTAYLMTPAGRLRKVVTYHGNEVPVTIPRAHAQAEFTAERDAWYHRDLPPSR